MSLGLRTFVALALLVKLSLLPATSVAIIVTATTEPPQTNNDLEVVEWTESPQTEVVDSTEDMPFPDSWALRDIGRVIEEAERLCAHIRRTRDKWCGPVGSRRKRTSLSRTMCVLIDRMRQQKCS